MTPTPRRRRTVLATAVTAAALALTLSGCTSNDGGAGSVRDGIYTSRDGATTVLSEPKRGKSVSFAATTATGADVSSAEFRGKVLVLNFWYAQCAPCIREAPRLEKLWTKFKDQGVQFLGVNTNDRAPQALQFMKRHSVSYPTTIETGDGSPIRFAFAGKVSPNTTPTTLVIDKKGRVAARFGGEITTDQVAVVSGVITAELDGRPWKVSQW